MEKKRPLPMAIYRIGTTSFTRGGGRKYEPGAASGCRIYLHGAYSATFIRSPRDDSPWREEGRRQLFLKREHRPGSWTDKSMNDRLHSAVFARDSWKRGTTSSPLSGSGDPDRKPAAGEPIIMPREEKPIDQPGSFVGRVSGVGANR